MYYRQGLLDKLEKKLGKYAVKNLMLILVGAMAIVWIMDLMLYSARGISLWNTLSFDRAAILDGQVWRVFTFLFLPPASGTVTVILSLYFYYFIGQTLEERWGAFGFNAYYLLGAIGAIGSGFITGYASNTYLNLTLFLAFAILFPRLEFRLFFLIPIEARWIALADAIFIVYLFIGAPWQVKVSIAVALLNLLIFFTPHLIDLIKAAYRRHKWNQNFKK